MIMKEEELKKILEKYYDGIASEVEEEELKKYFTSGNIMPGYEAEREIFAFFESEASIPEPSADFETRIRQAVDESNHLQKRLYFKKLAISISSAAAGILILTGVYLFFKGKGEPADTFNDPKIAYAETVKILRDVSLKMNNARASLEPVGKIYDVRRRGFGAFHRSATMIERNLKPLGYLGGESLPADSSNR
jgi:hypothetical protein